MQRPCADVNSPYKRKCWTNSGGPLINFLRLMSSFSPYRTVSVYCKCVFFLQPESCQWCGQWRDQLREALIDLAFSNSPPSSWEREIKRSGLGPKVHIFLDSRVLPTTATCAVYNVIEFQVEKTGSEFIFLWVLLSLTDGRFVAGVKDTGEKRAKSNKISANLSPILTWYWWHCLHWYGVVTIITVNKQKKEWHRPPNIYYWYL